jgi:hypothetical protein
MTTGLRTALEQVAEVSQRLTELSRRSYQDPYQVVVWPESVDAERDWFTSPELVSVYGTADWDALDGVARRRLAFHEAAGFYSLNIHGEKSLIQGLAARLYRGDLVEVTDYLHHFLDEENKHSIHFGGFCTRYARVYPSRQVPMERPRPRDVDDFLFFAKVMIFEELVDHYNRIQAKDGRLHPLARFINHNHHREEARHLAFGRRLVGTLWQVCVPGWDGATIEAVREELSGFFVSSWHEYYNPAVYADARMLGDPWTLAERAWNSPAQRLHRRTVSARCLDLLTAAGILTKEPNDAF